MARIVLVGFPGSGKTTVGKKLASKLQYDFIDLDACFEAKYRISVDLFFSKYDEEAFRLCERDLMHELLEKENCVISTGGGTPCFFDTMDLIEKSAVSIYLQMSPISLTHRLLHAQKTRPLLKGKGEKEIKEYVESRLTIREPYYLRSNLIFKGESVDVNEIVSSLRSKFGI